MAKGKSAGKDKREESASRSKTATRKKQAASSVAAPVEEKVSKPSAKGRARKTKADVPDPVDSPVEKKSKRVAKAPSATVAKPTSPAASDVPKKTRGKVVLDSPKSDVDVKPVKKTVRKKTESSRPESVVESKKKPAVASAAASDEKKRVRKSKNAASSEPVVQTDVETPVKKTRKKTAPVEPTKGTVKSETRKTGKATSKASASPEAAPTEKKARRGQKAQSSEKTLLDFVAPVVDSNEKIEVKQAKKRGAKPVVVEPEETKIVVESPSPKTKRAKKSIKTSETSEVVAEPKKKRAKVSDAAEKADAVETPEVVAAPKKKRAKASDEAPKADAIKTPDVVVEPPKKSLNADDAAEKTEKKRGGARRRKQTVEEKASETTTSADVAEAPFAPKVEQDATSNDSRPAPEDSAKKEDESQSETSKSTPRRKPSSPTRTQRRVLSGQNPDYLMLSVVNSYWLCAQWVVSDANLNRVRSAMGRLWHTAEPVLRVYRVDKNPRYTTIRRDHVSDVFVQLPVRIWYAPVDNPPSSFMVELGYRSRDGEFFTLSSSGVVETPAQFISDSSPLPPPISPRWGAIASPPRSPFGTTDAEKSSSPFDDNSDVAFRRVEPADSFRAFGGVSLKVGAEVVIKGRVTPGAILKIRDERIIPKPNGFFAARLELPERRHVFPVVATSYDGSETQTIILAIDRNTKALETVFRDDEE